jgi:GNAT superfamily N-acetyltransferase
MIRIATFEDASALGEVLADCVQGGASVNFMLPFSAAEGAALYERWLRDPHRVVLAATDASGRVDGTAQLLIDTPPNQPHRAELAKMLVHRRARRQGLARKLFEAVCDEALKRGRTLLTFDTMAGREAEQLYLSCGAVKVGEIPGFALFPEGGDPAATSLFYMRLK